MLRSCAVCLVGALLLLYPSCAGAQTAFLWPDGTGDYPTIQSAVSAMPDGSTIYLLPGTFAGPGNRSVAWAGKNLSIEVFGAAGSAMIDCEGAGRAIHVGAGVDSSSVISGLTFLNGSPGNGSGGAIDCLGAGPVILDCTFRDNSAVYGGAVRSRGEPAPRLDGCVFNGNSATYGGALNATGGHVRVARSTFGDNVASRGGAIYLSDASATLQRVTLCRNSASFGSAVWMDSSTTLIEQCIVAFNLTNEALVGEESSETFHCYVFGNCDGDAVDGNAHDNEVDDPLLCDIEAGDYHPCQNSPCLPSSNPWGLQVGHLASGCIACSSAVRQTSWGTLKALYR